MCLVQTDAAHKLHVTQRRVEELQLELQNAASSRSRAVGGGDYGSSQQRGREGHVSRSGGGGAGEGGWAKGLYVDVSSLSPGGGRGGAGMGGETRASSSEGEKGRQGGATGAATSVTPSSGGQGAAGGSLGAAGSRRQLAALPRASRREES
jgi:hypothetical protein